MEHEGGCEDAGEGRWNAAVCDDARRTEERGHSPRNRVKRLSKTHSSADADQVLARVHVSVFILLVHKVPC